MRARLGELDVREHHVPVSIVRTRRDDLAVLEQLEGELACDERTALKDLLRHRSREDRVRIGDDRRRVGVRIGEGAQRRALHVILHVGHTCRDVAIVAPGHRNFEGESGVRVVRHVGMSARLLGDGVVEHERVGINRRIVGRRAIARRLCCSVCRRSRRGVSSRSSPRVGRCASLALGSIARIGARSAGLRCRRSVSRRDVARYRLVSRVRLARSGLSSSRSAVDHDRTVVEQARVERDHAEADRPVGTVVRRLCRRHRSIRLRSGQLEGEQPRHIRHFDRGVVNETLEGVHRNLVVVVLKTSDVREFARVGRGRELGGRHKLARMDTVFVKVGHRYRELGSVARVLHATDNVPSVRLGHAVLVDASLVERDVPERNRGMTRSRVDHIGANRHDGVARQRSAHGQRLEKEAECVIGFPIAPLEHLVQPESRLSIEHRGVGRIGVRERNLVASRAIDRGRYHERARIVGSNADRDTVHRLVIRHARRPDGRHVLEHVESERLARVVLREVQVGEQGRLVRNARGTGLGIHERARTVAAEQRRSSVIGAGDVEGEFALAHIAAVECLAQDEPGVVTFRRIAVGEVERVLDRPRCRKHAVVVGHRHHDCGGMAIERHTLGPIIGNALAVPRVLAHHEGVRTRLGERCIPEGEVDRLAVRPSQRNRIGARQTNSAVRDGRLRRVIGGEQHEPEGLVREHVATGERLGARREVLGGNVHGRGRIGIAEGCERLGLRALRRVGKPVARRPNHNLLVVDYLARNVYPDDPRGLIIDHASLQQGRVSVSNVDPIASTIRHHLGDAILKRLADHVAREDDVPERHAAVGVNFADRVCGHQSVIRDRLNAEVEQTALKGIRARVVGVFLLHRGIPLRFPRGELVGERCGIDTVIGLDACAVVVVDLHHDARHIQYALMDGIIALFHKLFGHRDDHAIARLRQGHASSSAHGLILTDFVDVRARLRIRDVAERASRITAVSQVLLGEDDRIRRLAILVERHRSVVGRGGKDETEGVVVGPATTGQHLLDGKGIVVIERAARTIGVREFSLRLRTSSNRTRRSLRVVVFRRSYLVETSHKLLADKVFPARAQTANDKRLAVLERVRRRAAVVERDSERVAHRLVVRVADLGGEFLPLRLVDLDSEGERVVGKIGTIVALGDDQRLGNG